MSTRHTTSYVLFPRFVSTLIVHHDQLKHIIDLNRMLSTIRKSYLSVDVNPSLVRRSAPRELDFAKPDYSWSSSHSLSNEERDKVDLQARMVLLKCSERIRQLEELEKSKSITDVPFLSVLNIHFRTNRIHVQRNWCSDAYPTLSLETNASFYHIRKFGSTSCQHHILSKSTPC